MSNKKTLIVSDDGNQNYWFELTGEIKKQVGPVSIVSDKDVSQQRNEQTYDFIVIDVSDIEDLYRLIPEIHQNQPGSCIVIVSSTPTWKQTREVIRLGASSLIRKSTNFEDVIEELQSLSV